VAEIVIIEIEGLDDQLRHFKAVEDKWELKAM